MNVNPLADHPKQINTSPYAFTANNPVRFTDPTEMKWKDDKKKRKQKNFKKILDDKEINNKMILTVSRIN